MASEKEKDINSLQKKLYPYGDERRLPLIG
jgi:hypothetical protein